MIYSIYIMEENAQADTSQAKTIYLTREEREEGQKHFFRFQLFNGFSYTMLGNTAVYLLALNYGASNIQLGYISSAHFLAGFILPILPRLLAGRNLVKVQYAAWSIRGLVCLCYSLLYVLQGKAALTVILVTYTLFCIVRIIGVLIFNPVVKMISTSQNRGMVVSTANTNASRSIIVAQVTSYIVTSFAQFSGVLGILVLQYMGIISNTLGTRNLRRIPCRQQVEYRPEGAFFNQLKNLLGNRNLRKVLYIQWICMGTLVLTTLNIPFLRSIIGLPLNIIFLFNLVVGISEMIAGIFSRTFGDRVGSRPLIIGCSSLGAVVMLLWSVIPAASPIIMFMILGGMAIFINAVTRMLISRVVVQQTPDSDPVGFNSMVNFMTAISTFFCGLLGGILLDAAELFHLSLFNRYGYVFACTALLYMISALLAVSLDDKGSLSSRETAALFFSLDSLKAYFAIGKLDRIVDPAQRKSVLLSLGKNYTDLATSEIRELIHEPYSPEKSEMLRSLYYYPRNVLLEDLLSEATDPDRFHRELAVYALGAYRSPRVRAALEQLIHDVDPRIRSTAAKSLGRIGAHELSSEIRVLFDQADHPVDIMNYIIALHAMDPSGMYLGELFSQRWDARSDIFRQGLYALTAELLSLKPSLEELFSHLNLHHDQGIEDFLVETRDTMNFFTYHRELIAWFQKYEWDALYSFCRGALEQISIDSRGPWYYLRISLLGYLNREKPQVSGSDALAVLYFTYQISRQAAHRSAHV